MADAHFPAQLAQRNPVNAARFQRNFGGLEQSLAQITVMIRTRIRFQTGHTTREQKNCIPVSQRNAVIAVIAGSADNAENPNQRSCTRWDFSVVGVPGVLGADGVSFVRTMFPLTTLLPVDTSPHATYG